VRMHSLPVHVPAGCGADRPGRHDRGARTFSGRSFAGGFPGRGRQDAGAAASPLQILRQGSSTRAVNRQAVVAGCRPADQPPRPRRRGGDLARRHCRLEGRMDFGASHCSGRIPQQVELACRVIAIRSLYGVRAHRCDSPARTFPAIWRRESHPLILITPACRNDLAILAVFASVFLCRTTAPRLSWAVAAADRHYWMLSS
jgi:hypothetical protein